MPRWLIYLKALRWREFQRLWNVSRVTSDHGKDKRAEFSANAQISAATWTAVNRPSILTVGAARGAPIDSAGQ